MCQRCKEAVAHLSIKEFQALSKLQAIGVSEGSEAMRLIIAIAGMRAREKQTADSSSSPATHPLCGRYDILHQVQYIVCCYFFYVTTIRLNSFSHILTLEAVESAMTASDRADFVRTVHAVADICRRSDLPISDAEVSTLLFAIQCNAHRIVHLSNIEISVDYPFTPSSLVSCGLGLFPLISMINHSCCPNATHQFIVEAGCPPRQIIRAIDHIKPGDEICYSYVSTLVSTSTRQQKLRSAYGFNCSCSRCSSTTGPNMYSCAAGSNSVISDAFIDDSCAKVGELTVLPGLKQFFNAIPTCCAMFKKNRNTASIVQSKLLQLMKSGFDTAGMPMPIPQLSTDNDTSLPSLPVSDAFRFTPCHVLMYEAYNTITLTSLAVLTKSVSAPKLQPPNTVCCQQIKLLVGYSLLSIGYIVSFAGVGHRELLTLLQYVTYGLDWLVETGNSIGDWRATERTCESTLSGWAQSLLLLAQYCLSSGSFGWLEHPHTALLLESCIEYIRKASTVSSDDGDSEQLLEIRHRIRDRFVLEQRLCGCVKNKEIC